MTLTISPAAQSLYDDTLDRACSRVFLWWTTSSEASAQRQIEETFYTAASLSDLTGRTDPGATRELDLEEARLAVAALQIASGGDRLIAADEAGSANEYLQGTLVRMAAAPIYGRNHADWLRESARARAQGQRRLSASFVGREIGAMFRSRDVQILGSTDGMDPVEAVYVAYALNYYAGGIYDSITWSNTMSAGSGIELGLRNL